MPTTPIPTPAASWTTSWGPVTAGPATAELAAAEPAAAGLQIIVLQFVPGDVECLCVVC